MAMEVLDLGVIAMEDIELSTQATVLIMALMVRLNHTISQLKVIFSSHTKLSRKDTLKFNHIKQPKPMQHQATKLKLMYNLKRIKLQHPKIHTVMQHTKMAILIPKHIINHKRITKRLLIQIYNMGKKLLITQLSRLFRSSLLLQNKDQLKT